MIVDPPPEPGESYGSQVGVPGGIPNGVPGGVLPDILRAGAPAIAPPRPVEAARPAAAAHVEPPIQRYREGGNVRLGKLVHRVEPLYPRIAAMARISGVVELVGVVGIDGRIRELKLRSGHPMLAPAAIEAVRQWIYEPTTLNGDKVEIIAPITVTFRLN
jgi:protein TonB